MSTDYRIEIRRKADKKLLGIVDANCLKTILDAGLQDCLHIDGWSSDSKEFSYDDVCRCEDEANKKIDGCWAQIIEKKLMIPQSANADIMHELEEDIIWLKDELKDYMHAVWACGKLCGIIDCVVESFYYDAPDGDKFTVPGYVHNGKDLPKKTCTCNDGTTYEQDAYIWNDDVVCTIRVD